MNREVLIFLFPALASFLILFGILINPRFGKLVSLASSLSGFSFVLILLPGIMARSQSVTVGNISPPFGINLFFSPFSLGAALLIYLVASLVLIVDLAKNESRKGLYYLQFNLMILASVGLVLAGDLVSLFIFLELAALSSFTLLASGKEESATRSALEYFFPLQLAALLMLGGAGLLYSAGGFLDVATLSSFPKLNPSLALLVAVLVFLPVLLQARQFPLNIWVGPAYRAADPFCAASMSGMLATAAAFLTARLLHTLMNPKSSFSAAQAEISRLILILGFLSILFGGVAALKAVSIKKGLAFLSVGQLGMIFTGLSTSTAEPLKGAFRLLLSHTLCVFLLFMLEDFLTSKSKSNSWKEMKGIGRRNPLLATVYFVPFLALVGAPPFPAFWGKLELVRGMIAAGGARPVGGAAVLAGTSLEVLYLVRMMRFMLGSRGRLPRFRLSIFNPVFMLSFILLSGLLAIGLFPSCLDFWLESSVYELLHPLKAYREVVLGRG